MINVIELNLPVTMLFGYVFIIHFTMTLFIRDIPKLKNIERLKILNLSITQKKVRLVL